MSHNTYVGPLGKPVFTPVTYARIRQFINSIRKREDLTLEDRARALGFRVTSKDSNKANGLQFKIDNVHVWFCCNGWAVARLKEGYYEDHKYYPLLCVALAIAKEKTTNLGKNFERNFWMSEILS